MRGSHCRILGFSLVVLFAAVVSVAAASRPPAAHDIRPGAGVSEEVWLSKYFPAIAGTAVDTKVYVMNGSKPGPTALILGGTHGDEIAGIMAAVLLVERAVVDSGRLIVIPHTNNSASTYAGPGLPTRIEMRTPSGLRYFAYGSRRTNPIDQEPDPEAFFHYPTGYKWPGEEARNLDRAHPGKPDGNLTQQLAHALFQLITVEEVGIAIDLHEAGPGSRLAYMIIASPKSTDLGALAVVNLETNGVRMQLEQSSSDRGLSHREWGDRTPADAFVVETANPGQARDVTGADVVNDPANPLNYRVGIQLATVQALLEAYADIRGGTVGISGLPTMAELKTNGIGAYLK